MKKQKLKAQTRDKRANHKARKRASMPPRRKSLSEMEDEMWDAYNEPKVDYENMTAEELDRFMR